MPMNYEFLPVIEQWFNGRFGGPTEPQALGWPPIGAGHDTLIAAPTGSGKTFAAFLVCIDQLLRRWQDGTLTDGIQVLYVSPLKALSNDIEQNLQEPLAEIAALAESMGMGKPPIRAAVRTGDTSASQRQAMLRKPPHILVTTPESFYLLVSSERGRQRLATVQTVIVDEIHALARDKRGSHLSLSLERLTALCGHRPKRIGLSATQRPIDEIAHFLVGASADLNANPCHIVDVGHIRQLDLGVMVPASDLSAVCSHEQWEEIYERMVELIQQHRSTLIFVNTRRLAERVTHRLAEILGEEAVASHHGSLSRPRRLAAERKLKSGQLKAIVATASLEMGIDVGFIDLVLQVGSPRSIATFLQRVGRSGHCLKATPKGRLVPLTRDELVECLALVGCVVRGELDRIEIPKAPIDILAQQIIAEVACQSWREDDLLAMLRRAWPYRELSVEEFRRVLSIVSQGLGGSRRGNYVIHDQINHEIRGRKGARIAALTSGGAIPETAEYRVINQDDGSLVGSVDEDFAIESLAGDIFLLGNTSWRIQQVKTSEVLVRDAQGAPPNIPFWFGEAPGRTVELSAAISQLREEIVTRLESEVPLQEIALWLSETRLVESRGAEQVVAYLVAQVSAIGLAPTKTKIVFERFFDESGGMQLVIHSPYGSRINRAWGLALRKRFCRSFDFELQAAATDNGIVLSLSPQHSFPVDQLFKMVRTNNARYLLEQALLAAPMFQVRWRWNMTRSLAVLRFQGGKKVPPFLQRLRSDDLLAAAFPQSVGCLENHHGDVEIPDHPLVQQTVYDCLHEAMDVDGWLGVLQQVEAGDVELIGRDTREPSPFCHELLNANPYAFLDDAPLEERRSRAVATRRSLDPDAFADLARLDPAAIQQVREEAWPTVRDPDELHEALMGLVLLPIEKSDHWKPYFEALLSSKRAAVLNVQERRFWIAAERWPTVRAIFSDALLEPSIQLPEELESQCERVDAIGEVVRGFVEHSGPLTATEVANHVALKHSTVVAALEALEGQGVVLRGNFESDQSEPQWCDRRLLARIHRLTIDGLRTQIQPVTVRDYMRFLLNFHGIAKEPQRHGPVGLSETITQLQGFEIPGAAWERWVLPARISTYDTDWLDQLFLSGELVWGRLRVPRRDPEKPRTASTMNRSVPLSLLLRGELISLLSPARDVRSDEQLRSNAQATVTALREGGALFFQELAAITKLLPGHLEDALRELAAAGLVTSDSFAAIRQLARGKKASRTRRRGAGKGTVPTVGRWSLFPGPIAQVETTQEEHVAQWCRVLLARYGVVFREVLTREPSAPKWYELVRMLRQMEMRGEIRGGRFVTGVGGEQFSTESAIQLLRRVRDSHKDDTDGQTSHPWIVISAVDPLNLSGIVIDGPRVPASQKNSLLLLDGECKAVNLSGQVEFIGSQGDLDIGEVRRALLLGKRPTDEPPMPARSLPVKSLVDTA